MALAGEEDGVVPAGEEEDGAVDGEVAGAVDGAEAGAGDRKKTTKTVDVYLNSFRILILINTHRIRLLE